MRWRDFPLRGLRAGCSPVLDLRAKNAPLERFLDALSLHVMSAPDGRRPNLRGRRVDSCPTACPASSMASPIPTTISCPSFEGQLVHCPHRAFSLGSAVASESGGGPFPAPLPVGNRPAGARRCRFPWADLALVAATESTHACTVPAARVNRRCSAGSPITYDGMCR